MNILILSLLVSVTIDQLSKLVVGKLSVEIIYNTGISWGMMGNLPKYFLIFLSIIVLVMMFRFAVKIDDRYSQLFWGMILGGGVSNLIDRILYSGVRDWIVVFAWFPWFNVADIFISLGVFMLLVKYLVIKYK